MNKYIIQIPEDALNNSNDLFKILVSNYDSGKKLAIDFNQEMFRAFTLKGLCEKLEVYEKASNWRGFDDEL